MTRPVTGMEFGIAGVILHCLAFLQIRSIKKGISKTGRAAARLDTSLTRLLDAWSARSCQTTLGARTWMEREPEGSETASLTIARLHGRLWHWLIVLSV